MLKRRMSGVLLHVTSLPSRHGVGDLGPEAERFVDFLVEAKQGFWQILPLAPTRPEHGSSPYSGTSAFAGNPLLLSPDRLLEDGWIRRGDLEPRPVGPVDYRSVHTYKDRLLHKAFETFTREAGEASEDFRRFAEAQAGWLEDYATFMALRAAHKRRGWHQWPRALRDRDPSALREARESLASSIRYHEFLQYLFDRQWSALRAYCHERGIQIIGDMPLYLSYDSADVWSHREIFKLDARGRPTAVAGVPPDYFSATGQLWGNPLYRWDTIEASGFDWWVRRTKRDLARCDLLRIDHFRGLVACWEVPAGARTARNGQWTEVPGEALLSTLARHVPHLPVIAEDLGVITPDVRETMRAFDLPGLRVLQFAFDENLPANLHAPHHHVRNCIVYTGTHDNNTARGWFENETSRADKERLFRYLGRRVASRDAHWALVRLALQSIADLAVLPLQDLLGLGEDARMNRPASARGNWRWRAERRHLGSRVARRVAELTQTYGRA